ncbi:hypothetical protein [Actibacterium sp. D379-3]
MTAHSNFSNVGVIRSGATGPSVSMSETNWGYIISSDTQWGNRAALIERTFALAGCACLIAACGSWLFPQVNAAVGPDMPGRIASSLGMGIPALLFLWLSERGMGYEVQVDVVKSCLRQGVCNRRGKVRTLRTVPFDKIGSAFIKRGQAPGDIAQLFVRLTGGRTVHLTSGRETTLRTLHGRLSRELRPVRTQLKGWDRVGRRLTPAVD